MSDDVEPRIIFGGAHAQCFSGGIILGQINDLFTKKPLILHHAGLQAVPNNIGQNVLVVES